MHNAHTYEVLCMYDFRADHFVLHNQYWGSSLRQANYKRINICNLHLFQTQVFTYAHTHTHPYAHSQPLG